MSEEEPGEEAEAPKSKGGGGKILPLLLVMNTALIGGVLFYVMKRPAQVAAKPSGEHAADGEGAEGGGGKGKPQPIKGYIVPGPILKLENFVIQLKTVDQDRYVRVAFDIEVESEQDREAINHHLSHIRDLVISYFADRTLEELRGSEAMERTKASLIKRIDDVVPGHRIKNLFITDFIIQ